MVAIPESGQGEARDTKPTRQRSVHCGGRCASRFFPVALERRDQMEDGPASTDTRAPCLGAVPLTRAGPGPTGSAQAWAEAQNSWWKWGERGLEMGEPCLLSLSLGAPEAHPPRETALRPCCLSPCATAAPSKAEKTSTGPFCEENFLARTEPLRYRLSRDPLSV